jgi:CheY-like chemotaxis protein
VFLKPAQETGSSDGKFGERKLSILLVDDVEPLIDMFRSFLSLRGHTVFAAMSGKGGLEILHHNQVDVVLCDLAMPGMSGWDVGKAIRATCHENGVQKTPFILLTGWSEQIRDDPRLVESGVDAVVGKPVEFGELLAVITETIRRSFPE